MTVTVGEERWRLRDLAPPDRLDGWRAVVADTHLPWSVDDPPAEPGRPFDAAVRRRRYADVDVVDARCDTCAGARGPAELRATGDEHVGVLAVLAGREVLEQDGRCVELRAGDTALWDSTRPARFAVLAPLRKRTLLVPRALLGPGDPRAWTARRLPRGALPVALLRTHLQTVDRRPVTCEDEARLVARITADLVAGCAALGPDPGPATRSATAERREALRRAVEDHVARRLALVARGTPLRPDELTPDAIAAAHAVSTRALHQLFEPTPESLARRVLRMRLEHARAQLQRAGAGTVLAVATRWGFADASHFARAYRRQFGEPPRDTLARAHRGPA